MKRLISIVCLAAAFKPTFLLAADNGGGTGGGGKKTDLELLTEAREANTALTKRATDAEASVKTLTSDLSTAKGQLESEQKAHGDTKATLTATEKARDDAKAEVTKLTGDAKNADTRAREIAAANGTPPAGKDSTVITGAATDGKTHYDAYNLAMKENRGMDAANIWKAHAAAIEAHVATLEKLRD